MSKTENIAKRDRQNRVKNSNIIQIIGVLEIEYKVEETSNEKNTEKYVNLMKHINL